MSAPIYQLYAGGLVSPEQKELFEHVDEVIVHLIDKMKEADIPQGFIVALLHGHATHETINMMQPIEE